MRRRTARLEKEYRWWIGPELSKDIVTKWTYARNCRKKAMTMFEAEHLEYKAVSWSVVVPIDSGFMTVKVKGERR